MTLHDMLEAEMSWLDAIKRMEEAAYGGNAKELRDAVNDCDYVRHHITESFGLTPSGLIEQIKTWRGV